MTKIYIMKNEGNNIIEITNIVKEKCQLKKSIKNFAWTFDFSLVFKKGFKAVELGDVVFIKVNGAEVFSGVIIKRDVAKMSYTAIDYSWYFNNNEEIYQFEDVESSVVIEKLISTFGGQVGNIEATSTMVDKFFFGKTLGAIIKEVIKNIKDLEGKEYRFYYKNTKFHFELSKKDKYLNKSYTPKKALKAILQGYNFNALDYVKEPDYKQSIDKMRNAIKVYKTSGKEYMQTDEAKETNSIKRFGLLQKLVSFKDNNLGAGAITAENILSKEGKVKDKLSLTLPTLSEFVYDGELLELDYEKYSIKGVYEVSSITYTFNNLGDVFSAKMELEKVD